MAVGKYLVAVAFAVLLSLQGFTNVVDYAQADVIVLPEDECKASKVLSFSMICVFSFQSSAFSFGGLGRSRLRVGELGCYLRDVKFGHNCPNLLMWLWTVPESVSALQDLYRNWVVYTKDVSTTLPGWKWFDPSTSYNSSEFVDPCYFSSWRGVFCYIDLNSTATSQFGVDIGRFYDARVVSL